MKKLSILLTTILLLISAESFSQNMLKKWYISGGVHAINHPSVRGFGEGLFETDNWSFVPPLSQISVARTWNHSFAVDLQASIGEIDNKRLENVGVENEFMALVGLGLRYRFANGYIMKETSWFDPYLRFGANYYRMPYRGMEFNGIVDTSGDALENGAVVDNDHFALSGGLGINFWIWPKIGVNIETQYVAVPATKSDYIDFFQAKAGLAFRFGKNDRDKDGIVDEEDECPDTPGLPQYKGCPDTDGDKLEDRIDECPLEPCPNGEDTDEYYCVNGCKVMKEKVEEPPVVPEPPVVVTPEPPKEITFEDVLFEFDQYEITADGAGKVKEAADLIKEQGGNYFVDGFADSKGSDEYNINLSRKRAQAVKDALVKEGVPAETLEVRAFGEQYPKCTNDTEEGRQCNRRVVVLERY
jgi:outer membrane protein OmpA-like peptidoglycan-associated protein